MDQAITRVARALQHSGKPLANWDASKFKTSPRAWAILLTSANHGTVGPLGSTFPHAGEHHERVVVVEVPAAAGAPSDEVNLVLCAAPAIRAGANTALEEERIWQLYREAQDQGTSPRGTSPTVHFARAIEREVAAQAGQVAPVADMTKEQIVHRAIVELRVFAPHELRQDGQVAVPEGWKLVPLEPTMEMVTHGFESAPHQHFSPAEEWAAYAKLTGCQQAAHRARLCYAAMLAAAPSAPVVAQQAPAQAEPIPQPGDVCTNCHCADGEDCPSYAKASTAAERQEGGA